MAEEATLGAAALVETAIAGTIPPDNNNKVKQRESDAEANEEKSRNSKRIESLGTFRVTQTTNWGHRYAAWVSKRVKDGSRV
jgi:hypothetical protein